MAQHACELLQEPQPGEGASPRAPRKPVTALSARTRPPAGVLLLPLAPHKQENPGAPVGTTDSLDCFSPRHPRVSGQGRGYWRLVDPGQLRAVRVL